MSIEFKIRIPDRKHTITLNKTDLNVLLARRNETLKDLAGKIGCTRENLSRVVNGRRDFPTLRKKLCKELTKMIIEEQQQQQPSALSVLV